MPKTGRQPIKYSMIPGYTGYRAGADGSLWSCLKNTGDHWHGNQRQEASGCWKQLKPYLRKSDGRARFTLRRDDGKLVRKYRSHFVLMAFVGPRPDGLEACHNDGNCRNDRPDNLRWDTRESNVADMIKHGSQIRGTRVYTAKLDEKKVIRIRKMRDKGATYSQIAVVFGVTVTNIMYICRRRTWQHV